MTGKAQKTTHNMCTIMLLRNGIRSELASAIPDAWLWFVNVYLCMFRQRNTNTNNLGTSQATYKQTHIHIALQCLICRNLMVLLNTYIFLWMVGCIVVIHACHLNAKKTP